MREDPRKRSGVLSAPFASDRIDVGAAMLFLPTPLTCSEQILLRRFIGAVLCLLAAFPGFVAVAQAQRADLPSTSLQRRGPGLSGVSVRTYAEALRLRITSGGWNAAAPLPTGTS